MRGSEALPIGSVPRPTTPRSPDRGGPLSGPTHGRAAGTLLRSLDIHHHEERTVSAEDDVVDVIRSYVEGAALADPDLVKASCLENADFRGFFGDQFTITSPAEYADTVVKTSPAPGDDYTHQIHSVVVTGDIASAVLEEQNYLGFSFRDNLGLARVDGSWKIASKVFTTI